MMHGQQNVKSKLCFCLGLSSLPRNSFKSFGMLHFLKHRGYALKKQRNFATDFPSDHLLWHSLFIKITT